MGSRADRTVAVGTGTPATQLMRLCAGLDELIRDEEAKLREAEDAARGACAHGQEELNLLLVQSSYAALQDARLRLLGAILPPETRLVSLTAGEGLGAVAAARRR